MTQSLKNELVEAIFNIDQAIGHIEIIVRRIQESPQDAAPGVPGKLLQSLGQLDRIAANLERLRRNLA